MERTEPRDAPGTASDTPECNGSLAVLVSGGLDSAILLAEVVNVHARVYPLYIRQGLFWESAESSSLRRYLEAVRRPGLERLHVLEMPLADLYGTHWSVTGAGVPDSTTPDEAVFLPGRNVLLLAKSLLWCHLHGVAAVALGSLQTNPFADATAAFFQDYQKIVNNALGGSVQVLVPYAGLGKREVMRRGMGLPLELTFSCLRPVLDRHCGRCNKCGERRQAFAAAGLTDLTLYHTSPVNGD